ncbi:MAG: CCA tRNA nucleotidyltransferase [Clostridia bacterium]|nr:CCA tRNA nucleotidyltransferase [Clostridia bacterium]
MIDIAKLIPNELIEMAKLFPKQAPLYIVGGFVRDAIEYNTASEDIDITSALTPPELAYVLKNSQFTVKPASPRLGTMIVKGQRAYEYTSFRVDSYPQGKGNHAPQEVLFTRNIEKDAKRRDFKCNAVYYDIVNDKIVDPLGGIKDIQDKILNTTIEPTTVLSQDGLRIMRLARMVATHNYSVAKDTLDAAKELTNRLRDVSIERISTELVKILISDHPYEGLDLLRKIGSFRYFLPELDACDGEPQNPKYHLYDVLEHTFKCVEFAPKKIRIAALFHDVGKPVCMKNDGNTYKHDIVGATMTKKILTRMKFPNNIISHTVELVDTHMFDMAGTAKKATIRRFIAKHADVVLDIVALQKADGLATGLVSGPLRESELLKQYNEMKDENVPFKIVDLKISGNDLLKMGFKGKTIGTVLDEMFDNCVIGCIKNEEAVLRKYAEKKKEKLYGTSQSDN